MSDFDKLQVRRRSSDAQLTPRVLNQNNQQYHQQFRSPAPVTSEFANSETQGIAIRYYLKVLYKNKWIILLLVGLITGSVWYLLKRVEPLYEASATIQIDPEKMDVLENKTVLYQNWLDPEYYNTQLKLLTNPSLIKQVVQQLELDKDSNFISKRPTTLSDAFYQLATSKFRNTEAPAKPVVKPGEDPLSPYVGEVTGNLQITPVPKTRLVRLTFRHYSPELAQKLVNTLAEIFIRNNLVSRTSASKATSVFLQQRLAALQSEIQTAEQGLIDYGKTHAIVSLDADQNTVVERLATLNRQLLEVESIRKEAEAAYRLSQSGTSADTVPEVLANATIRGLQDRLSALRQKRLELLTTFTEEWPEVKQTTQTIAQLEKELQAEKNKIIGGLETRYRTALERERLLRGDFNSQMGTTLKQNESAVNYRIKQQEVDTRKELYKNILVQLKQADIASSSDINNITLSTPAPLPVGAVSPRYTLTLTMAFFCSMVGALGLAFIRDYLSTKINSVEDVDRFVNLPTLGLIPEFKPEFTSKPVIELLSAESETSSDNQQLQLYNGNNGLSAFKTPDSAVAEAYRHLRTSMILAPGMQHNKAILVTSGQPGEGKSTTASNIAIALAHTGARTVIIDADLRKPSLHLTFNIEDSHDLGQYLSGYVQMEDLFNKTAIPNLTVISSNNSLPPLYPAELLGSPRMRDLIAYCRNTRDYLIIDSPPILPFADAAILSAEVDGVLLVVNAEFSRREVVQRARRMLEEIGANLIGVVLNNVSQEKTSYGGYYRYGYKYRNQSSDSIFSRVVDSLKNFGGNQSKSTSSSSKSKSETPTATVNIKAKNQQFEVSVEKDEQTTKTFVVDEQKPISPEVIASVITSENTQNNTKNNTKNSAKSAVKPVTEKAPVAAKPGEKAPAGTTKSLRKIKAAAAKPVKKKSAWKSVAVSFHTLAQSKNIKADQSSAQTEVVESHSESSEYKPIELGETRPLTSFVDITSAATEQLPTITNSLYEQPETETEANEVEDNDTTKQHSDSDQINSAVAGQGSKGAINPGINHQDRKWRKRKGSGKGAR